MYRSHLIHKDFIYADNSIPYMERIMHLALSYVDTGFSFDGFIKGSYETIDIDCFSHKSIGDFAFYRLNKLNDQTTC